MTRVLILNANPDASPGRSSSKLATLYARGAEAGGHEIRRLELAAIAFPPIITGHELEEPAPQVIVDVQSQLEWCEHLVIAFPLWLGGPPALLKSLFEQICRYDFAFDHDLTPLLSGRSVRLLVSAWIDADTYAAGAGRGVDGFEWGVLRPCGFDPIRVSIVGNVDSVDASDHTDEITRLGMSAA